MKTDPIEDTEFGKLLAELNDDSERVEFTDICFRVFKTPNLNDELFTVVRINGFYYRLIVKIPEKMATERAAFAALLVELKNTCKATVASVESQLKKLDERVQYAFKAISESNENNREIWHQIEWIGSEEFAVRVGKNLQAVIMPEVKRNLEEILQTAKDVKFESHDMAAKTYAREASFLNQWTAIDRQRREEIAVQERKCVRLTLPGALLALTAILVIGFAIGTVDAYWHHQTPASGSSSAAEQPLPQAH
jgi:hypothetical protein